MAMRRKPGNKLTTQRLKRIITGIFTTRERELSCDECLEELDRFAELVLAGKDADAAIPLVRDHLDRCRDCREEFEALLAALKDQAASEAD